MTAYWICCRARYGDEFKKQARMIHLGMDVYLPVKKTDVRTKRKCRTEISPLFPPYMFIRFIEGEHDIHPIKRELSVLQIMGEPAKATDSLIQLIRARESNGVHMTKYEYEKGDRIRMESGIFKDYEGEIRRLSKSDKAIIRELTTGREFEVNLSDAKPIDT